MFLTPSVYCGATSTLPNEFKGQGHFKVKVIYWGIKHSLKEGKKFCVAKVLFFLKRMSSARPLGGLVAFLKKFGSCLRASYDLLHIHIVQTRLY